MSKSGRSKLEIPQVEKDYEKGADEARDWYSLVVKVFVGEFYRAREARYRETGEEGVTCSPLSLWWEGTRLEKIKEYYLWNIYIYIYGWKKNHYFTN